MKMTFGLNSVDYEVNNGHIANVFIGKFYPEFVTSGPTGSIFGILINVWY